MSIAIPLYIFLFTYLAFLIVFATFFIFNLTHLMHTGGTTMISFFCTISMITVSAFIIFFTWVNLKENDWKQTITINIANGITSNY